MDKRMEELAEKIKEKVIQIRHNIHQHPELGRQEFRTVKVIETFLDEISVSHTRCTETGVVASIGTGKNHVIGLRADIDALPMPDLSDLPYTSENEGYAHACGHDGHTAILLGTAWVLKQLESELDGTVKLIFQPDEEGGTGAASMVENGVLDTPTPEAVFALHAWPEIPVKKAGYRFGTIMASESTFMIDVRGKGCHGAQPHAGVDPITIAARIVEGIQLVRSRMIDPVNPIVISVCTIQGGSAFNVIPDNVTLSGTIRTLDPEARSNVHMMIERMAVNTALASGGEVEFRIINEYPPTTNEKRATAFARDTLNEMLGSDNTIEITKPSMGGEDFSYILKEVPGSFILLGVGDKVAIHNSSFDFNDDAIPVGIRIMAGLAVNFLGKGLG